MSRFLPVCLSPIGIKTLGLRTFGYKLVSGEEKLPHQRRYEIAGIKLVLGLTVSTFLTRPRRPLDWPA